MPVRIPASAHFGQTPAEQIEVQGALGFGIWNAQAAAGIHEAQGKANFGGHPACDLDEPRHVIGELACVAQVRRAEGVQTQ